MSLDDKFDDQEVERLRKKYRTYKAPVLEYIFLSKYNKDDPRERIPFTSGQFITIATSLGLHIKDDGDERENWANVVKDLTRGGNYSPRSEAADREGYVLHESRDDDYMGVFILEESLEEEQAIECPSGLEVTTLTARFPNSVGDLFRPDEGGLLSVIEYCDLLSKFFGEGTSTVKRVQTPVKMQPEIDGLYVLTTDEARFLVPCEAKSKGGDVINLHQIEGSTDTALKVASAAQSINRPNLSSEKPIEGAYPIGAKILDNGDVHIAKFGLIKKSDADNLHTALTTKGVEKHARYRLSHKPPQW